jgi:hypothetical protein
MTLTVVPMTLREARAYVDRVHRHHRAPQGGLFAIGAAVEDAIVGVVIIGRPVARGLGSDDFTAEITRLASDGTRNVCSLLYAAAWRACRAMGYRRLVTYTLATEPGSSLRAVGFSDVARVTGRSWHCPSRPRVDTHPLEDKIRWELTA